MQCEKWCFCTGSQNKCTYIACILMYLYVYDSVFCMYFVCIHVFCMYIAVSMRLATFRTENTCIYVQYVHIRANTSQHTCNIRAYTHFIFEKIRATYGRSYVHIYASICKYMHVYVCVRILIVRICKSPPGTPGLNRT
jgi:hypothetical protein